MDLNTIWFIIIGTLFSGYVILDGFDLGVGSLHLFAKTDTDRRILMNAIGPVWDGNEVWLVTGGGALFAAFPDVYATVFSGFYNAFILLLVALIFRAVSIEFRSKEKSPTWRKMWDIGFFGGSILSSFLIGVAVGNIAIGIPLNAHHEFTGTFLSLLNPYSLFLGITTISVFMLHGSIYLYLKTEGDLQHQIGSWVKYTATFFLVCFIIFNTLTFVYCSHIVAVLKQRPFVIILFIICTLTVLNTYRQVKHHHAFAAFLSSCLSMILLLALFASSMYPYMVYALPHGKNSLSIYNSASTDKTLTIMLIIACIGVPIVLAYTACTYYIFRGKVKLTEESY